MCLKCLLVFCIFVLIFINWKCVCCKRGMVVLVLFVLILFWVVAIWCFICMSLFGVNFE